MIFIEDNLNQPKSILAVYVNIPNTITVTILLIKLRNSIDGMYIKHEVNLIINKI